MNRRDVSVAEFVAACKKDSGNYVVDEKAHNATRGPSKCHVRGWSQRKSQTPKITFDKFRGTTVIMSLSQKVMEGQKAG
jgi:hypothetical protein